MPPVTSVCRYLIAAVAVAVATGVVAALGPLHLTNGSMLYLAAVLVVAIVAGRGPAILAAAGSFLVFNYLFTEPRLTLTVSDPDVLVTLVAFLLIAVVTSQLAASLRERVAEANAREREARLLHDLAALLATRPLRPALEGIAERLHATLGTAAVCIEIVEPRARPIVAGDADALRSVRAAPGPVEVLGPARLDGGVDATSDSTGRWRRVIRPHGPGAPGIGRLRRIPIPGGNGATSGSILLLIGAKGGGQWVEGTTRLLATVAGQVGIAVEQEALRQATTEAELLRRTDELRQRLLGAVSHDLRTPLASIIAAAGSLRQTDVDWSEDDRRDFAASIEQEAERLNRIVGNLLDLGRIQDGAVVPRREWQDPSVVLQDAVDGLRARIADRTVVLDVPDDLPTVLLDAVEIQQVVVNLVENAARVSAAPHPIRVTVAFLDGELVVGVEDEGPGLPPGPPARLFEPFVRGAGESPSTGSGLGLAIARGLVAAHGGRIWAENRPGGGARFAFSLPGQALPGPELA